MGLCSSRNKLNFENIPIEAAFNTNYKYNRKLKLNYSNKNDFYLFTNWILKYNYYIHLSTNNPEIKAITKIENPKDLKSIKLIKNIDSIDRNSSKNLSEFSSRGDLLSINSTTRINSTKTLNLYLAENKILYINQQLCKLYEMKPKKIQKILIDSLPNNLRWHIWSIIAKCKFEHIDEIYRLSNEDIYNYLLSKDLNDELRLKVKADIDLIFNNFSMINSEKWKSELYNLMKCLFLYYNEGNNQEENNNKDNIIQLKYSSDYTLIAAHILIISDCNVESSFQVLRFICSDDGLQLNNLLDERSNLIPFFSYVILKYFKDFNTSVYNYIDNNGINNSSWIHLWLHNLYHNILNFQNEIRLLDFLIAYGIQFLIDFSIHFINFLIDNNLIRFLVDVNLFYTDCNDLYTNHIKKNTINNSINLIFKRCVNDTLITEGYINKCKIEFSENVNFNYYDNKTNNNRNLKYYFAKKINKDSNESKLINKIYKKFDFNNIEELKIYCETERGENYERKKNKMLDIVEENAEEEDKNVSKSIGRDPGLNNNLNLLNNSNNNGNNHIDININKIIEDINKNKENKSSSDSSDNDNSFQEKNGGEDKKSENINKNLNENNNLTEEKTIDKEEVKDDIKENENTINDKSNDKENDHEENDQENIENKSELDESEDIDEDLTIYNFDDE